MVALVWVVVGVADPSPVPRPAVAVPSVRPAAACEGETIIVEVGDNRYYGHTKTVPLPERVASCPSPCGRGCRTNRDFAWAGDTFDVTVHSGEVTVERTDVRSTWWMRLAIPCCGLVAPGPLLGALIGGCQAFEGSAQP